MAHRREASKEKDRGGGGGTKAREETSSTPRERQVTSCIEQKSSRRGSARVTTQIAIKAGGEG